MCVQYIFYQFIAHGRLMNALSFNRIKWTWNTRQYDIEFSVTDFFLFFFSFCLSLSVYCVMVFQMTHARVICSRSNPFNLTVDRGSTLIVAFIIVILRTSGNNRRTHIRTYDECWNKEREKTERPLEAYMFGNAHTLAFIQFSLNQCYVI